jgi:hypothetical protein
MPDPFREVLGLGSTDVSKQFARLSNVARQLGAIPSPHDEKTETKSLPQPRICAGERFADSSVFPGIPISSSCLVIRSIAI